MKAGLLSIGLIFIVGGVAGLLSAKPFTLFPKVGGKVTAVTLPPEVKDGLAVAAIVAGCGMVAAARHFLRTRILDCDEACLRALHTARIFAGHNRRKEITPADLLRGLLHATQPESAALRTAMKVGYGDEVAALKQLASAEREQLGHGLKYSREMKRILARANQRAIDDQRDKVGFFDLLRGLIIERPPDVASDLAQVGKKWEEIEGWVKS